MASPRSALKRKDDVLTSRGAVCCDQAEAKDVCRESSKCPEGAPCLHRKEDRKMVSIRVEKNSEGGGRSDSSSPTFQGNVHRILESDEQQALQACAVSPHDTLVASSCARDIRLWEISSGSCVGRLAGHTSDVTSCSFGRALLVSGSRDGEVILWRYKHRKKVAKILVHHGAIRAVLLSSNGRHLATASADGTGRIFPIQQGKGQFVSGSQAVTLKGHVASVNDIAFSGENRHVITCSDDGQCKIWENYSGCCLLTLDDETRAPLLNCSFRSDDRHVISVSRTRITIWSLSKQKISWEIEDRDGDGFQGMACNPSRGLFVIVSRNGLLCGYNMATKSQSFQSPVTHQGQVSCCRFSASGRRVVTCADDGKIIIWK